MSAFDKAWNIVKSDEDEFYRRQFEAKMNKGGKKHSCPTCKQPNRLSDAQKRRGYQCDECADKEEGAY
jgi:ribosomal protein L37AE/L43A